ncbi:MAG: hypothetical protein WD470_11980 [Rhodospirillaceae bacterium]
MQVFSKFSGLVREFGFANAVLYLLGRVIRRVCPRVFLYRYYIVAQPVPPGDLLPPRRGRAISVRELRPGDPAFAGLPLDETVLAFRFRQDVVCLGAFQEGTVIGCLWLAFGAFEEDEVRCIFALEPAATTAWDFDVYLRPEARLGFAFLRLWDEANRILRARGAIWSVSRISAFNPGSLASHRRMGAVRIASLTALKGPRRQFVLSSIPPRLSLASLAGALPRYAVSPPKVPDAADSD